jgi:hypothetical protein
MGLEKLNIHEAQTKYRDELNAKFEQKDQKVGKEKEQSTLDEKIADAREKRKTKKPISKEQENIL